MPSSSDYSHKDRFNDDWITINEAVNIINNRDDCKITKNELFRQAFKGRIHLSIYFQSPVTLRKVNMENGKVKLTLVGSSLIERLCFLERECFLNGRELVASTGEICFFPKQQVFNTSLIGYEHFLLQRLFANSLKTHPPIRHPTFSNYGVSVECFGSIFQLVEKTTYAKRIKSKLRNIPYKISLDIANSIDLAEIIGHNNSAYFPLHTLPKDSFFVIKKDDIKIIPQLIDENSVPVSKKTRISTPLSRLFWLACQHNELIKPLIKKPYKLLNVFEQWAFADGIKDHLSGDTLKNALERGSPPIP